jgi:hypothetical protein
MPFNGPLGWTIPNSDRAIQYKVTQVISWVKLTMSLYYLKNVTKGAMTKILLSITKLKERSHLLSCLEKVSFPNTFARLRESFRVSETLFRAF